MPKITTLLSRILKLDLFKAQAFNKNCWILQNFNILKNILFQFITKFLRKMHLKKSCYPNKKQKENEVFSFEVMGTRNFWQSNWCRLLERECGIPNLVVLSRLSVFYLLYIPWLLHKKFAKLRNPKPTVQMWDEGIRISCLKDES